MALRKEKEKAVINGSTRVNSCVTKTWPGRTMYVLLFVGRYSQLLRLGAFLGLYALEHEMQSFQRQLHRKTPPPDCIFTNIFVTPSEIDDLCSSRGFLLLLTLHLQVTLKYLQQTHPGLTHWLIFYLCYQDGYHQPYNQHGSRCRGLYPWYRPTRWKRDGKMGDNKPQ